MRFHFYIVEQSESLGVQLRQIESAALEVPYEQGRAAVEDRFQQLVASNPDIANIVIVSPTIGEPPGGAIVAAETITALPNRPRRLMWVVDQSTGL